MTVGLVGMMACVSTDVLTGVVIIGSAVMIIGLTGVLPGVSTDMLTGVLIIGSTGVLTGVLTCNSMIIGSTGCCWRKCSEGRKVNCTF